MHVAHATCNVNGMAKGKAAQAEPVEIAGVALTKIVILRDGTPEARILREWGDRIARWREVAGLSQEELAERLEVSVMSVRRWENGQSEPRLKHKLALARELGDIRDLFPLTGAA